MKVATWNVNSIRTRQQQVVDWLQRNPVDVLCLQETKVVDEAFPTNPFEALGYHLYLSGQKSYNGVAIFSRTLLQDVSIGFGEFASNLAEFDAQKRVITGVVNDIRIINLYVPNGAAVGSDKYDYKLCWLKALREYLLILQAKASEQFCICGDFNIALEDKDIYTSKGREDHIMSSPAERQALKEVLAVGFKDTFRKFTDEGGHFSWWDYRAAGFERNRGWRIDHIYLTPRLYERAISCKIDVEPRKSEKPSDHTPVIVELAQNGCRRCPPADF